MTKPAMPMSSAAGAKPSAVKCWTEMLEIPTYAMGPDEKHPIFKDVNLPGLRMLRSGRSVYPYTLMDKFTQDRQIKTYEGVWLENDFIKVLVIPDLRGRLQGAIDKRNGWDFLYFNHVIKPADIAIRRFWISGGIEWNHPGGHGYTQLSRLSYKIIEEPDGSKTVLVAEIEPVRMMKWETAITLRPGRLYVETQGRLSSIVPHPIPFASSQNAAMHATDKMEMIYPRASHVTGHGKTHAHVWPVSDDGVDESWFSNLQHGLSYFVDGRGLLEDYWGCYSHDPEIDAGTVIVADHRTAPGKKYFSWGSHAHGRSWDTHLSDEDGPYVELQVQAFWDNLGYGYAWLNPYETKDFTVYWYPIMGLGGFVKASQDVCLNIAPTHDGRLRIAVQATREVADARVVLYADDAILFEDVSGLMLATPYATEVEIPDGTDLDDCTLEILDATGKVLLSYACREPEPVAPRMAPKAKSLAEMTLDELSAHGKSFYQDPWGPQSAAAFEEMLKRDPVESRAHRGLAWIAYHHGQMDDARAHFEKSLINDPLNQGYEAFFGLGLTALADAAWDQAREHFIVASRHQAYCVPALAQLAVVEMQEARFEDALRYVKEAQTQGGIHPNLDVLAAIALRLRGHIHQAQATLVQAEDKDALHFGALYERWFLAEGADKFALETKIHQLLDRCDRTFVGSQLYLEGAVRYIKLGLWNEAVAILEMGIRLFEKTGDVYPMLWYYLGYCKQQLGDMTGAGVAYNQAAALDAPYLFPYRPLSINVLHAALEANPSDATGWLCLGNLLFYLRRHHEAVEAWEQAAEQMPDDSRAYRNLANATWFLDEDLDKTIAYLERALECDQDDARLIYELDHVYAAAGKDEQRLAWLERNERVVRERDDLVLRWVDLLLRVGGYKKAVKLLDTVRFSPREMRVRVAVRYTEAHYGVGLELLEAGDPQGAIAQFELGHTYPDHLSESAPAMPVWTRFHRLMALAYEALDDDVNAHQHWQAVIAGPIREGSESVIDQAVAFEHLGEAEKARSLYQQVIEMTNADEAMGKFLLSQAHEGLGALTQAAEHLKHALAQDPDVILKARIEASYIPLR